MNRGVDVSLLLIQQKEVAVLQKDTAKVTPVRVMKLIQEVVEFP